MFSSLVMPTQDLPSQACVPGFPPLPPATAHLKHNQTCGSFGGAVSLSTLKASTGRSIPSLHLPDAINNPLAPAPSAALNLGKAPESKVGS